MSKFDDMYSSLIMESVKSFKLREIIDAMKERLNDANIKSERSTYLAALEKLHSCFAYYTDSIVKIIELKQEGLFEDYKSDIIKLFRELRNTFAEQRRYVLADKDVRLPSKEEFLAQVEKVINEKVNEIFQADQVVASEIDDIRQSTIEFVKERFGNNKNWNLDDYNVKNEKQYQKNIKASVFSALDASSIEDVDVISITEFKEFNRKKRAQYGFAIGLNKNIPLYTVSFDDDGKIDYISNINGSDKYLNMKRVEEECDELLLIKNIGKYSEQSRQKRNAPKPNLKRDDDWEAYQNRSRYENILQDRRTKEAQVNVAKQIDEALEKAKDVITKAYKKISQFDIFDDSYKNQNLVEKVMNAIQKYKNLKACSTKFKDNKQSVYSYQVTSAKDTLKTFEDNIKELEEKIIGEDDK